MAGTGKGRLVRCPSCQNVLRELPDHKVYQCGGCGAILQAAGPRAQPFTFDGCLSFRARRRHPPCDNSAAGPRAKPSTYDVFLSFRGDDTRNNFVAHLYSELTRNGIYAFKDDEKLERGKRISKALRRAIRDSKLALVIFSTNYAHSCWCLDELEAIIKFAKIKGQIVIPIFYHVNPSDVRNQRGSFARAFTEHRKSFEERQLEKWRRALNKVASYSGWHLQDRDEAEDIKNIVGDISDKLISSASIDVHDVVGMASQVKKLLMLLSHDPNVGCMLGIWGMGGIGKSTTAKVIYNHLSRQFLAHCFLSNVKDRFEKLGPAALQSELLSKLLSEKDVTLWPLGKRSTMIKKRLCHKKVLIVLDDVDNVEQLEVLAKGLDWFGPGSRIIITTRDRHVLLQHGVNVIHEAEYLKINEALQLFSQCAFKLNQPLIDYLELSKKFVSYADGLPLALRVLGSFLHGRNLCFWQSELKKLEKFPNVTIQNVLKISYDGLEFIEKCIFLDVACFFNGRDEYLVRNFLNGCGFFPDRGLDVLMDKAMITISDNKISMHDLLQEMGRGIVRQESEELGCRSRFWDPKDIFTMLSKNKGTKKVEGIALDMSKIREVSLTSKAFTKMDELRLLAFYDSQACGNMSKVQVPDGLQFLSDELRYLYWYAYPLESLPASFCARELVELHLPYGNIKQFCAENMDFENLKVLDLSHTPLSTISGVSLAQKLESLNLEGCRHLTEVSSIQFLTKLVYLNLANCEKLECLPSMSALKSLMVFNLSNCSNLSVLPQSVGCLSNLIELNLTNCIRLENLPSSIQKLESVKFLNIVGCPNLLKLGEGSVSDAGNKSLELQHLGEECSSYSENNPLELQRPGEGPIPGSGYISIEQQPLQMSIPSKGDAAKVVHFGEIQLMASSSQIHICALEQAFPGYMINVTTADVNCTKLTGIPNLVRGQQLVDLNLQNLTNVVDLSCIRSLTMVRNLKLEGCSNLRNLPSLPVEMENLNIAGTAIEELPRSVGCASSLVNLNVSSCKRLKYLPSGIHRLNSIQVVNVAGCSNVLKLISGTGNKSDLACLEGNGKSGEDTEATVGEPFGAMIQDEENRQKRMEKSSLVAKFKNHEKGKGKVRCAGESMEDDGDLTSIVQKRNSVTSGLLHLPGCSIPEVMADLQTLEEVKEDDTLFYFATLLVEQTVKREIYMSIKDPKRKVGWLKFQYYNEIRKGNI